MHSSLPLFSFIYVHGCSFEIHFPANNYLAFTLHSALISVVSFSLQMAQGGIIVPILHMRKLKPKETLNAHPRSHS